MKKKKVKRAVDLALKRLYKNGFTNTAAAVRQEIMERIDKIYHKK